MNTEPDDNDSPEGHPLEGQQVAARTYRDDDREIPARAVAGTLTARHLSGFDRYQCFVDDELVDPATVVADDSSGRPEGAEKNSASNG